MGQLDNFILNLYGKLGVAMASFILLSSWNSAYHLNVS
jgi:hypothetical protein